jgi:hypothetical protein
MIETFASQSMFCNKPIAQSVVAPGTRRLALPAALLACATALGLFAEAGSHSAHAYFRAGGGEAPSLVAKDANEAGSLPVAVYWDEPAYPQVERKALSDTAAMPVPIETVSWDEPILPELVEIDLGAGEKLGRSDIDGTIASLPGPAVAALGLEEAKLAPNWRELGEELDCLALNIYFEARNEPSEGQAAVAHVVLNRVSDPRFPDTVCSVVRQGGERVRYRCQFSWWCDGLSDRPRNQKVWEASKAMARDVYLGRSEDPTSGALWYHADYVMPYWGRVFERGPKIGRHIFYHGRKQRVQVAASQEAE